MDCYTGADVDETFNNIDSIFIVMLVSDVSTAFTAFIYSKIDVNMKRLNIIFNPLDYN